MYFLLQAEYHLIISPAEMKNHKHALVFISSNRSSILSSSHSLNIGCARNFAQVLRLNVMFLCCQAAQAKSKSKSKKDAGISEDLNAAYKLLVSMKEVGLRLLINIAVFGMLYLPFACELL